MEAAVWLGYLSDLQTLVWVITGITYSSYKLSYGTYCIESGCGGWYCSDIDKLMLHRFVGVGVVMQFKGNLSFLNCTLEVRAVKLDNSKLIYYSSASLYP